MLKYSRRHVDKSFNFTGAAETEILASLPVAPTEDDKNDKEEDPRMVTLIVTVDEELLKRIETFVHPDVAAEPTTKAEVGEEAATKDEPGEPPLREFKPKDTLDRLLQLIFQMMWN